MSSRPQSSAHFWRESPFRSLFLHLFPAADAEALRHVGELLYALVLEYCPHWEGEIDGGTPGELVAIAADLRYLETFLRFSIGPLAKDLPEDDPEGRLPREAVRWAPQLGDIADEIVLAVAQ